MGGERSPHSAFISSDYFNGGVCVCVAIIFLLFVPSLIYISLCHISLTYSNDTDVIKI